MEKSVLRKEMKRLRREMTAEERKIRDEKIFENLTTLSRFKDKKWFLHLRIIWNGNRYKRNNKISAESER